MDVDVVVVGAGAAGAIAARNLARAGRSVAIIEARERIGGRLMEANAPNALAPVELGAEFVHGRPKISYELLHEIGAGVIENADVGFVFRNGALEAAEGDPFEAVAEFLATALDDDADRTVDDLIARAGATISDDVASWTRRLVSGFDAADPARASARAVAREWAGDASADGSQSRPAGGYAPLAAHLAASLDTTRVDIRLGTIVKKIARTPSGVRVTCRSNAREFTVAAKHAIVTIPHGVLTAPEDAEAAIAFEPPLPPATQHAIDHIAMGPVVKVVLEFREAFWESLHDGAWRDGSFFNGDGAFPTLWTQLPVRAKTLVAWAGGPAADRLYDTPENERTQLALACAGRYFGDRAAAERAFETAYEHDWQRDPFALGAYSYVLAGGDGAREALRAPVDGTLWFAGEATASDVEGGTVAGALESGVRAARSVIDTLAR